MIVFHWKGNEVVATLRDGVWEGPPDLRLDHFKSEEEAAERLGGRVVDENLDERKAGE